MDLVVLTRERIEEAVDDAVDRGRMTRKDAQAMTRDLVTRGRKQTNEVLKDLENLLQSGRQRARSASGGASSGGGIRERATGAAGAALKGVGEVAREARTVADPALATADRARRTAGVGPSFPVLGYDDLTAQQVQNRLGTLTPAELRKVRDHERRNANRKSVLNAIESKLK